MPYIGLLSFLPDWTISTWVENKSVSMPYVGLLLFLRKRDFYSLLLPIYVTMPFIGLLSFLHHVYVSQGYRQRSCVNAL